jgi:signal transduction histidine kinase
MSSGGLSFLDQPVSGLSDEDLLSRLETVVALERRLAAARLECVHELSGRGVPAQRGYANAGIWLEHELKLPGHVARGMARLATGLASTPDLAEALAEGEVSEAQAEVIAKAVATIKDEASPAEQASVVDLLVEQAPYSSPDLLAKLGKQALALISPEAADERERLRLENAEKRQWQDRGITLRPDVSGRVKISGWLTAEAAALFWAVLDPLCNPARRRRKPADTAETPESPNRRAHQRHQRRQEPPAQPQVRRRPKTGPGLTGCGLPMPGAVTLSRG